METGAGKKGEREGLAGRGCRRGNGHYPWELAEIQNPKSNGTQQYNAAN